MKEKFDCFPNALKIVFFNLLLLFATYNKTLLGKEILIKKKKKKHNFCHGILMKSRIRKKCLD